MSSKKISIPFDCKQCEYCLLPFEVNEYTLSGKRRPTRDHFIPMSKGGGHGKKNIFIVCQYCNTLKGDFLPEEFIYWLGQRIRHKEFPGVNGFTYNEELLKTVKICVSQIYGCKQHVITTLSINSINKAIKNKTLQALISDSRIGFNVNTLKEYSQNKDNWLEKYNNEPEPSFHLNSEQNPEVSDTTKSKGEQKAV